MLDFRAILALGPALTIGIAGIALLIAGSIKFASSTEWDSGKYQFMQIAGGLMLAFSSFVLCIMGSRYHRFKVLAQPGVVQYNNPQPGMNLPSSYPTHPRINYGVNQPLFNQSGFIPPLYAQVGYPPMGYHPAGYMQPGYSQQLYSQQGFHQTAFDQNGCNHPGFNSQQFNNPEFSQPGFVEASTVISPPPAYQFHENQPNPTMLPNVKH